jgi:hypothetical protein
MHASGWNLPSLICLWTTRGQNISNFERTQQLYVCLETKTMKQVVARQIVLRDKDVDAPPRLSCHTKNKPTQHFKVQKSESTQHQPCLGIHT